MRKHILFFITLVPLLFLSVNVHAAQAGENFGIVFRDDIPMHRQLADKLETEIRKTSDDNELFLYPITKDWSFEKQTDLLKRKPEKLIAIGDIALSFCLETSTEIPGVFLMLTSKHMVDRAEATGKWKGAKVWVEPQIQFKVIHQLMPDVKTVGIVLTPNCKECNSKFTRAAAKYDLKLNIIQTEERRQIIPAIQKVFKQSDTYLLLPDPILLNNITLQELLRLQREHQRPLIGPAMPFVRMGAMLSINYRLEKLVKYLAKHISNKTTPMEDKNKLSECCLEISINTQVSEQLGVKIKTDTMKDRIKLITPEVEN